MKCKGYSKTDKALTYEDFETLDSGGYISQEQMQFKCPKSNYMSETDSFNIKTKYVTRKSRQIYTKGVVSTDGTVTPHRI